jgi:hypothetical protein
VVLFGPAGEVEELALVEGSEVNSIGLLAHWL